MNATFSETGPFLLKGWAKEMMDVLFPRKCLACGTCFRHRSEFTGAEPICREAGNDFGFHRRMAPFFCPACLKGFQPVTEPICTICGEVFISRHGLSHQCGRCEKQKPSFSMARSAGIYEGPLHWAVIKFKYAGFMALAAPLGDVLREAFHHWWIPDSVDGIVPVPLHPKKMRQRGFNQSYLITRSWVKSRKVDPNNAKLPPVLRDVLVRTRYTPPQAALKRSERKHNLVGAFNVPDTLKVKGLKLLLVDDVMTSGETVEHCARALLNAGARQVDVLTLARALA